MSRLLKYAIESIRPVRSRASGNPLATRSGYPVLLGPRFCGDERWLRCALVGAGYLMLGHTAATAEPVEDFYRGRTITIYVGTGMGAGAVSAYPMALAPVIKKYIPGNPNVVVSHMPGAGGIKAASFIESIGPQDGTAWAFITRARVLLPLPCRPDRPRM